MKTYQEDYAQGIVGFDVEIALSSKQFSFIFAMIELCLCWYGTCT
jgi:hypothetical protein